MNLATVSVLYLAAVIALAHLRAVPAYDWHTHTISELAAQATPNAWVMRLGFVGFGTGLLMHVLGAGRAERTIRLTLYLVGLYGAAVALSGIFSTAPIGPDPVPRPWEAQAHSALATLAGISLSAAMLVSGLRADSASSRLLHWGALLATVGLSSLFGLAESGTELLPRGVVQRAVYAVGLGWLLIVMRHDGARGAPRAEVSR